MTKNELNRFQKLLIATVTELDRLGGYRDEIQVERSADQLDEIQRASERALAVSNLDREYTQLRNARAALRRIEDGSFGTCLECEEDIHPKRLAAVPWTPFCIQCQEALDRNPDGMKTQIRDFSPVPPEGHRWNTGVRRAA